MPSALTLGEATPVRLRPGEEIGDLEIRLASGRTFNDHGDRHDVEGCSVLAAARTGVPHRTDSWRRHVRERRRAERGWNIRSAWREAWQLFNRDPADDAASGRRRAVRSAEFASVAVIVTDADVEGMTVVTQPGAPCVRRGHVRRTASRIIPTAPCDGNASLRPNDDVAFRSRAGRTGRDVYASRPLSSRLHLDRDAAWRRSRIGITGRHDITDTPTFKPGKTGSSHLSLDPIV